jgi:hypothetical protein
VIGDIIKYYDGERWHNAHIINDEYSKRHLPVHYFTIQLMEERVIKKVRAVVLYKQARLLIGVNNNERRKQTELKKIKYFEAQQEQELGRQHHEENI